MEDLEIVISLIAVVASTLSFLPTAILVFRRWFRGQHTVSHRANGLTLAALMVFQLVLFANHWSFEHWSFSLLLALVAIAVCTLNLSAWRAWRRFVRGQADSAPEPRA